MPEIFLTTSVLRETSQKIANCRVDIEGVIKQANAIVESLEGTWEGEAQKAFMSAWESKKSTYDKFSFDLNRFADFLSMYTNAMENTDVAQGQVNTTL